MTTIDAIIELGELADPKYCTGCRFEHRYFSNRHTWCPLFLDKDEYIEWDAEGRAERPGACRWVEEE